MSFDPGFRAARKAGAHGTFRMVFPLVFLGFLVLFAGPFSSGDGFGTSTPFLVVAGIAALIVLSIFAKGVQRWARNRGAWSRAARGAVSLTLRGEAVAERREVSGRPMRTVVVEHRGHQQYLHLLFPQDAPVDIMGPGRVTVEFFAGDDVVGPARLLLADGRTLWAFTSRLGARPKPGPRAGTNRSAATSSDTSDGGAGLMVPALVGGTRSHEDRDRGDDGAGDGPGVPEPSASAAADSTWSGGDGWTGGSSWGGDATWTGSDGGGASHTGGGGDGGGWFGGGDSGGWSGGDSGGGGGDSGGGS